MVGTCKQEEIGKEKQCKLCGNPFIVGRPIDKNTFIYCKECSFILNSNNYNLLSKEQKEKRNAFINSNDELYQKEYYNKNKNAIIKYQINYKRKHPARRCINKMKIQTRHNEETLQFATRQRQLWSSDEAQFIEENAEVMTAREIAISIGRSYLATLTYASKNKIRLQTENKLHNKLITK